MSQQHVEIIKRVVEAGSRRDFDTVLALHHPDWEGFIPEEYPVAGTWRGLDGVRGFAEEWLEAWEEFRVEPEEFIEGGDAVVAAVRYWGRGRGSGVQVTDRWYCAYRRRDGKVISWRPYADRDEALKAAGLAG
ncbi:MAG TPA: nuclear transport factor 2 family protein [Solirubrobacteraceae bacterium]|nr:nuclear transport factor 2 family protein [Solirubrobacteraceae bacterium]